MGLDTQWFRNQQVADSSPAGGSCPKPCMKPRAIYVPLICTRMYNNSFSFNYLRMVLEVGVEKSSDENND